MTAKFLPMLAVRGEPFDSPQHLFEVKWDGVRAVAAVEGGRWQVWGRDLAGSGVTCPPVRDYLPTLVTFMRNHREADQGVMV